MTSGDDSPRSSVKNSSTPSNSLALPSGIATAPRRPASVAARAGDARIPHDVADPGDGPGRPDVPGQADAALEQLLTRGAREVLEAGGRAGGVCHLAPQLAGVGVEAPGGAELPAHRLADLREH